MIANEREAVALARLLKIARLKSDEAGRRVSDLKSARQGVLASLELLEKAVSSEETSARAAEIVGFVHFAGFLAGAAEKRASLSATLDRIDEELAAARRDLEVLHLETGKLDHLVETARSSIEKRRRQREEAGLAEAAILRFSRRGGR